jgi:hypothetical protein
VHQLKLRNPAGSPVDRERRPADYQRFEMLDLRSLGVRA